MGKWLRHILIRVLSLCMISFLDDGTPEDDGNFMLYYLGSQACGIIPTCNILQVHHDPVSMYACMHECMYSPATNKCPFLDFLVFF